jgi:hypothetical protein
VGKGKDKGDPGIRPASDSRRSKRAPAHDAGPSRQVAHRYSEDEKERGLVAVALNSGNCARAAELLADQGQPIPERTLRQWRAKETELYARVEDKILPAVRAKRAADYDHLAERGIEVSRKGLERLDKEIGDSDKLSTRDLPGALRNVGVFSGIGTDKSQVLRDLPTEIKSDRSAAEIIRALREKGVIVDGEAEDVTEAEVVDPRALPPS